MDERSLEWLRLLDSRTRFEIRGAPPALLELLADRLGPNPNAVLGWRMRSDQLPASNDYDALALVNPRGVSREQLVRRGFERSLSLCALPSLEDPRVFVPLANRKVAARAFDFITLYRPVARLKRAVSLQLARVGQLQRIGDRLVLARRSDSELERWLRAATGYCELSLAISPGGISHKRKVTIQVMAMDGMVVGFAKLAASPAGLEAMRREAARLDDLARDAELAGFVPRVVASGMLDHGFVTLLTPGPGALASQVFSNGHYAFLCSLRAATRRRMRFEHSEMWRNLQRSAESLEPQLTAAWRQRAVATLARLIGVLGGQSLELYVAHRDFQPGNMRRFRDGRLFVYDWEGAQPECTPLYDFFNFTFLHAVRERAQQPDVVSYVMAQASLWFPDTDRRLLPIWLLAYLIDHALRRLTNSDFERDRRSVFVVQTIGEILDRQAAWIPASTEG